MPGEIHHHYSYGHGGCSPAPHTHAPAHAHHVCPCVAPAAPPAPALTHDVLAVLTQINGLSLPSIKYALGPHEPIAACPAEAKDLARSFAFDARLVRNELHHPLLAYLAEGVAPNLFTSGLPALRIQSARELLEFERPDGYRSLQAVVYGTLLLSLNTVLLHADAYRNKCLPDTRLWSISAPCGSQPGPTGIELKVGGTASVAVELHPSTVVSNELIDTVVRIVEKGVAYDTTRGRAFSAHTDGCALLHHDALNLLTQVWTRFARATHRKDSSISWVVLTNLDKSVVFQRKANEIKVSHVICGNGTSTPSAPVQNLYSLLLSLAVLEKPQYAGPSLVELVHLL